MVNRDWIEWLQWLKTAAPLLLVYSAGIILSLAFLRRWRRPSLFTLAAFLTKLTVLFSYEAAARALIRDGRMDLWETMAILFAVIDASAYGLLIAAIFSARTAPTSKFPTWPPPELDPIDEPPFSSPQAPAPADSTGIQEHRL